MVRVAGVESDLDRNVMFPIGHHRAAGAGVVLRACEKSADRLRMSPDVPGCTLATAGGFFMTSEAGPGRALSG